MLDLRFGLLVKNLYITEWKRLETPNLVKNYPNLVSKKFLFKPDQWVIREYEALLFNLFENREASV